MDSANFNSLLGLEFDEYLHSQERDDLRDAEYDESLHPRDERGRWTDKDGGAAGSGSDASRPAWASGLATRSRVGGVWYRGAAPDSATPLAGTYYTKDRDVAQSYADLAEGGAVSELADSDRDALRNTAVIDLDTTEGLDALDAARASLGLPSWEEHGDINLAMEEAIPAFRDAGFDSILIENMPAPASELEVNTELVVIGGAAWGGGAPSSGGLSSPGFEPLPHSAWRDLPADPEYLYHATSLEAAHDIALAGTLDVHDPAYGTDQDIWPDGSIDPRAYFTDSPRTAWSFAPEEGRPVLLRVPRTSARFHIEHGTGDRYTTDAIPARELAVVDAGGAWVPVSARRDLAEWDESLHPRDDAGRWVDTGSAYVRRAAPGELTTRQQRMREERDSHGAWSDTPNARTRSVIGQVLDDGNIEAVHFEGFDAANHTNHSQVLPHLTDASQRFRLWNGRVHWDAVPSLDDFFAVGDYYAKYGVEIKSHGASAIRGDLDARSIADYQKGRPGSVRHRAAQDALRATAGAGYDESDHPRVPAGQPGGGRWVDKDGAAARASYDGLTSRARREYEGMIDQMNVLGYSTRETYQTIVKREYDRVFGRADFDTQDAQNEAYDLVVEAITEEFPNISGAPDAPRPTSHGERSGEGNSDLGYDGPDIGEMASADIDAYMRSFPSGCQISVRMEEHEHGYDPSRVAFHVEGDKFLLNRTFNHDGDKWTVDHEEFRVTDDDQGAGIAKDILRENMAVYDKIGVSRIALAADCEVGAYAWAKFGFRPAAPANFVAAYKVQIENMAEYGHITQEQADEMRALLSPDAGPMDEVAWRLADHPAAKLIMTEQIVQSTDGGRTGRIITPPQWSATMKLSDKAARARFARYVGGK